MQPHTESVAAKGRDGVLRPYAGVLVTVTTQAGALATLFSDNGVTTQANPITSDANGMYQFYAADGLYTVTLVGDGTTLYSYKVLLEDIGDPNAINATTLTATGAVSLSSTLSVAGQTTLAALTATGQTSLGGAAGAEAFRAVVTGSGVNRLQASAGTAGVAPILSSAGLDATIPLRLQSLSSSHQFFSSGTERQFTISHTPSAVNYPQVTGAVTAGSPFYSMQGADANIVASYQSKGVAGHFFSSTLGGAAFSIAGAASANANYWQTAGATTGNRPALTIQGSDTNPGGSIFSKGTGDLVLGTNGTTSQFVVTHVASAVNQPRVSGSSTGTPVLSFAEGTDTNIDWVAQGKGTGSACLRDSAGSRKVAVNLTGVGFFGTAPIAKPAASGSRGGNAALASLLTQLATLGLITDSTSA